MMAAVRFEKWQALGNDYLIVEAAALPFPLTAERVRRLCDPHFGPGGDGVLELSRPDQPGFVARLRIFNPDGSEAELSGNGAREAILYLRHRGWTDADTFSIETAAGEIRPTITGETTCRVDMMVAAGAEAEVRAADAAGASAGARQALGFRQLLEGDVEAMKTQTRRYAKRQLTWMRKLPDVTAIDVTDRAPGEVAAVLHEALRAREAA